MRWAVLREERPHGLAAVAPKKRRRYVRANGEDLGVMTAEDIDTSIDNKEDPLVLGVYIGEVDAKSAHVAIQGRVLSTSRVAVVGCGESDYSVRRVENRWCCSDGKRCWPRRAGEPNPTPRKLPPPKQSTGPANNGGILKYLGDPHPLRDRP
jgi:hypothetical protein